MLCSQNTFHHVSTYLDVTYSSDHAMCQVTTKPAAIPSLGLRLLQPSVEAQPSTTAGPFCFTLRPSSTNFGGSGDGNSKDEVWSLALSHGVTVSLLWDGSNI